MIAERLNGCNAHYRLYGVLNLVKGLIIGNLADFLIVKEEEFGYSIRDHLLDVILPVV